MGEFWVYSVNKVQLQEFFNYWLKNTCNNYKQVYLVDCDKTHFWMQKGVLRTVNELKWTHEEADPQIQHHTHHVVNKNILVSSGDTDDSN